MMVQSQRRMKAVLGTLCIASLLFAAVVEGAVIVRRHFEVNFPGIDSLGNIDYDHQVISTRSVAFFNTRTGRAFLTAHAKGVPNQSGRLQVFVDINNSVYAGPDVNLLVQTNHSRYVVTKRGVSTQHASGKIVPGNVVP
jgi:hypothetical protein